MWADRLRGGTIALALVVVAGVLTPGIAMAREFPPLVAPTLIGPAPYAASSTVPVFEWTPVPRAFKYDVRIVPIGGSTTICGGETIAPRLSCFELPPGPYTWTVRAIGHENRLGPYATPRAFTKLPRLLTAPSLTAPANGSLFDVATGPAILRWTPVPNAAAYQVQLSDTSTFGPPGPIPQIGIGTEAFVLPFDDLDDSVYWRVRAITTAEAQAGPWSAARSVRLRWSAIPQLASPADGATVSTMDLVWEPLPHASSYLVQAAAIDDPQFANPISIEGTVHPFVHWDVLPVTSFRWRVRAVNGDGGSTAWSPARVVTIDAGADPAPAGVPAVLGAPTLLDPVDGATGLDPTSRFSWTSVAGTIGYDLQILPATQDWNVEVGQPAITSATVLATLDAGVTYHWRVRANRTESVHDVGPWSEERTFSTEAALPISLTSPADGATRDNEQLVFAWAAVPSAPLYWVETSATPDFAEPTVEIAYADPRHQWRNRLAPGTWYWRIRSGRNNVLAASPIRTLQIVDDTPPVGNVGSPNEQTEATQVNLEGPADDAITDVARVAVSHDGGTWFEYDYGEQPTWSWVTPEHGGPDPGPREIWMKWQDTAGNWSEPVINRFRYGPFEPDSTAPLITAPRVLGLLPAGQVSASGVVPMRVTWSVDEATCCTYHDLRYQSGPGGWTTLVSDSPEAPPWTVPLPSQRTFRLHLRARDGTQNQSPDVSSAASTLLRFSETNASVRFGGTWSRVTGGQYLGSVARATSRAGATASLTTRMRSIGFVSTRGPSRGAAQIYVDGVRVATVDLYAPTTQGRQVVWSMDWATSATRRVTVKVVGTLARPRVDFDAFVVLS